MSAATGRDFASVLEEILNAQPSETPDPGRARPSIPFDVTPATAVDAFWSSLPSELVAEIYRETSHPSGNAGKQPAPPIQPELIAAELGLDRAVPPKNLDRLRRSFAFRNHPDRVRPEFRELAVIRMQIANRLIDDAKRRALGGRGR